MRQEKIINGRPTKYLSEFCETGYKQCLLGSTDKQLAEFFGISLSTLYIWKNKYPDFSESLRLGKEIADSKVAYSIYQRAIGMTIPDFHISIFHGEVKITPIEKYLPPDVSACIFWLKNRQKEKWNNTPDKNNNNLTAFNIVINEEIKCENED